MKARTSRRALFGSAALLATLPAFARPHGPDHELIAVCGAFVATCDQHDAGWNTITDDSEAEREGRRLLTILADQVDRMGELHAMTAEGIQARSLALARFYRPSDMAIDAEGTIPHCLLSYLLRDAAALGGAR